MMPLVFLMGVTVLLALIALLLNSFVGRDVSIEEIMQDLEPGQLSLFDRDGSL